MISVFLESFRKGLSNLPFHARCECARCVENEKKKEGGKDDVQKATTKAIKDEAATTKDKAAEDKATTTKDRVTTTKDKKTTTKDKKTTTKDKVTTTGKAKGCESCEYGSMKYYMLCGFGGALSCGLTHTAVVPLDLVKCRIQTNPTKYKSIVSGFLLTVKEEGPKGLGKGWAPTLIGYSFQGLGKFGFYELFKNLYTGILGDELAYTWRTSLYLAASASAEFWADIALCPFEACKVRIQTQPRSSPYLREVMPDIVKNEGLAGLYKGISPLWLRQIPYTMMKFACFERTVEALYKYVVPKPRNKCSKAEQLIVTFSAGYIAGVFCALVSHPADTVVSKLNQDKGSTAFEAAKKLGMEGLWKGLTPRIIMIGTLTALQWFIYDGVKVWLRLPRPPPPEMPDSLKKKQNKK